MKPNLARWDRGIRLAVGLALIGLGMIRGSAVDFVILGMLGLALLATAVIGVDPLYRIYGVTTRGGLSRLPCDEHGESCRPEFHRRG